MNQRIEHSKDFVNEMGENDFGRFNKLGKGASCRPCELDKEEAPGGNPLLIEALFAILTS